MNEQLPQYASEIVGFFKRIGLEVDQCELLEETFLPGIAVKKGRLRVDPAKLKYPGDLLHEAGHLAVIPPEERQQAGDDFAGNGGNEMAAIAWSYAACMHLDLPLEMLFHETGYKGDARWLSETYSAGSYIGLPMLVWRGMANETGVDAYPEMRHWLCL